MRASVRSISRGVWDYLNFYITSSVHLYALVSRACLGLYGPRCSYPTVTLRIHVNDLIAVKIHRYTPTRLGSLMV